VLSLGPGPPTGAKVLLPTPAPVAPSPATPPGELLVELCPLAKSTGTRVGELPLLLSSVPKETFLLLPVGDELARTEIGGDGWLLLLLLLLLLLAAVRVLSPSLLPESSAPCCPTCATGVWRVPPPVAAGLLLPPGSARSP
jgi:hypothetical protein